MVRHRDRIVAVCQRVVKEDGARMVLLFVMVAARGKVQWIQVIANTTLPDTNNGRSSSYARSANPYFSVHHVYPEDWHKLSEWQTGCHITTAHHLQ